MNAIDSIRCQFYFELRMIKDCFLPVVPRIGDSVNFGGSSYRIKALEWHLERPVDTFVVFILE